MVRSDTNYLTGDNDDEFNLHKLFKHAKFKLIGLNSSFIRRLNSKLLDEINLNERLSLKENSKRNYQTFDSSDSIDNETDESIDTKSIDAESTDSNSTDTKLKDSKFRLKPKKRLLKLLNTLNFKNVYRSMNLYEELKPGKDEDKQKRKRKKKMMKKIKKITMDVCTNISSSVHLMNGYSEQSFNYDYYYDVRSMHVNYNGYDYKVNDYNYNSTIIYGPRYM